MLAEIFFVYFSLECVPDLLGSRSKASTAERPLEMASKICCTVVCSFSSLNHGHKVTADTFYFFFPWGKSTSSSVSTSVSCLSYTQWEHTALYNLRSKRCAQKRIPRSAYIRRDRGVSEVLQNLLDETAFLIKDFKDLTNLADTRRLFCTNVSIDEKGNR